MEFGGGGVAVGFCFGGRRGPVSFRAVKGKGASQLWSCLVLRGMEASQLPGAVKGKGGESALEFGGGGVAVGFCFGGRRGPVSFRAVKGKGGESALEFGGGGVAVCFCFGGGGGQSASGL